MTNKSHPCGQTTWLTEEQSDHINIKAIRLRKSASDVLRELVEKDRLYSKSNDSIDAAEVLDLLSRVEVIIKKHL